MKQLQKLHSNNASSFFFIFQVVDRIKSCLDISFDPATFVQVTKTAMSFSSEIMQK